MDDQERSRDALIEHIAEQDRIIRRRNEQIARQANQIENQAQNVREAQRAIEEQRARKYSLAADFAAAVSRAEKAEQERDECRAMHSEQIKTIARLQKAEQPRTLTADINDEMIERARWFNEHLSPETIREVLTAALTEPTRPEEKVELVLRRYWSGDIDRDDLADRIVEEMNR